MIRLSMMLGARQRLGEGIAPKLANVDTSLLSVLRLVFYLMVTVAAFGTIVMVAVESPNPVALFKDDGPWEWIELSLFAVSAALCFVNARRNEIYAHILELCGLLALFAAFRELDHFLDELVFDGAYKVINGVILGLFVYLAWIHRWTLTKTLARFTKTAPFYFFVAAVLVVVYGQIIGQAELWQALMGDYYVRSVKRVAEELAEFMGYLLLFYGALETCFMKDAQAYHPSPAVREARILR
jgi:hypothetical protein